MCRCPGSSSKQCPGGPVLEARLRGPNVTPGFWRDEALTRASFDEEGFYKLGDAIAFTNPEDPAAGFVFQGRLAEDFKLSTGTFVRVGPLRGALLMHLGDLVADVVIAGHDRAEVCGLLFPNVLAMRALCEGTAGPTLRHVLEHPAVAARLRALLAEFSRAHPGSASCLRRLALLEAPPSFDEQEITAKGSINQKAVLTHRREIVDQLYGSPGSAIVIDLP